MISLACKYAALWGFGIFLAIPLAGSAEISDHPLSGETGSSLRWGSGWIDLTTPTDFKKGDRLKLKIGGTAEKILVRLLPEGMDPGSTTGIVGDGIKVPESRIIEITLQQDHKRIGQISVHGGPNPWGKFPLGGGNGPATLLSAERIKPPKSDSEPN